MGNGSNIPARSSETPVRLSQGKEVKIPESEMSEAGRTHTNGLASFLLIFRKAAAGELHEDSGLGQLAELAEIDVDKEGVKGARDFFSAKIEEQSKGAKFEAEIKAELEEKKREAEERKIRRQAFKEKQAAFMSA
uniref:EF-hand domain-containing protein n=1 Tax=Branchiostoma floridae TaxID=7739 RepID=C3XYI4_BRAFL|eukprot:XP_002610859.1 hypothetical protein BRAFLDRAFT_94902 [Branchiostoma floridae]